MVEIVALWHHLLIVQKHYKSICGSKELPCRSAATIMNLFGRDFFPSFTKLFLASTKQIMIKQLLSKIHFPHIHSPPGEAR